MHKLPSKDRILQLIEYLPVLDKARNDLAGRLKDADDSHELLQPGLAWGTCYDLPVCAHFGLFALVSGLLEPMLAAVASEDHVAELQKLEDHPDYQEWKPDPDFGFEPHDLLGIFFSMVGTIESIILYGYYLNELLDQAFEEGNDDALFKAIRVDRMVVTSEKAAHRIALAVVRNDRRFLSRLQSAMEGKKAKQAKYLQKFRFLMQLMVEADALQQPIKDIRALVFEVGAYADAPGAEKNLNELIRKFRKKSHHLKWLFEMVARSDPDA